MNLKLRSLLLILMVVMGNALHAQINYSQPFEDDEHDWTTNEEESFELDDTNFCNGMSAYSGYAYNYLDWIIGDAVAVSPSLGASSGMPATLSFNFKILTDDGDGLPVTNWGSVTIEYAASASGPWTAIESFDSDTYFESPTCTLYTTAPFSPPASSNFYLRFTVATGPTDYITQTLFVLDDVNLTQAAAPGCTTTPAASSTVSSVATACTTTPFQVSLSPAYQVSGLNFQWQSSPDNTTYTDLAASANAGSIDVTQTVETWYRAIITCPNGGTPVTSTPVKVMSTGLPCYCVPDYVSGAENITRVKIGTLDNITSADPMLTVEYENFTTSLPATPLTIGVTYPIILEGNTESTSTTDYTNHFTAFFDFNRDGDFDDDGEDFYVGEITGSDGEDGMQATASIMIPASATTGNVVMRIVKLYDGAPADACGEIEDFGYGQTEDYLVNLVNAVACSDAPAATGIITDEATICLNSSADLSLTTTYENSGITYQWQKSTDGFSYTNIDGATAMTYNAMQTQSTWYRVLVSCGTNTTTSSALQITTLQMLCYCDPEFEEDVEAISYVSFGTMLNESDPDDEENHYEDFTSVAAPVVVQGQSYPLSVGGNTWFADENYVVAYFDWNHDGEFDEMTEGTEVGILEESDGADGTYATSNVTVPADAATGTTRMRIVKTYFDYGTPCYQEDYGQAEDYFVTVDAAAGTGTFDMVSFRYYPNPVKDKLTLSYDDIISGVEVYNLVGQRVMNATVNANETSVDVSRLAAGTYIVKVFSGSAMQAVKVVKQ